MFTLRLLNNQVEEFLIDEEKDILTSVRALGLDPICDCSQGNCGKCKARMVNGNITDITDTENELLAINEKFSGWFLMCQRKPLEDLIIDMPQRDGIYFDLEKSKWEGEINPFVKKEVVDFNNFELGEFVDYQSALLDYFADKGVKSITTRAMEQLVPALALGEKVITVIYADRILSIETGDTTDKQYGVAVDMGTATVGMKLIDIANGEIVGKVYGGNSQRPYGNDVAKRVDYVKNNNGDCSELHDVLLYTINKQLLALCERVGIDAECIYDMVLVGNTQLSHLFFGISPQAVDEIPMFLQMNEITAGKVGIKINEMANISVLSCINGEFGGDANAIGDLVNDEESLVIDLGIDTTLILNHNGTQRFKRVSTPVFDGMCIHQGRIHGEGAINGYFWKEEMQNAFAESEGYMTPNGISGTGLWSLIPDLKELGYVDADNKFNTEDLPQNVKMKFADGPLGKVMTLAGGGFMKVELLEKDIQLLYDDVAKLKAEVADLVGRYKLNKVIITGMVGADVDVKVAEGIGLLPESICWDKVEFVPEMALNAATERLLNWKSEE